LRNWQWIKRYLTTRDGSRAPRTTLRGIRRTIGSGEAGMIGKRDRALLCLREGLGKWVRDYLIATKEIYCK
jgi:hypothetical protein